MVNQISAPTRRLSIFYTNDFHGNTDNFSGLLLASKQFDASSDPQVDTIKISAGDNYAGGDVQKNSLVTSLLSALGISVSAVGNHELDVKPDEFAQNIKDHDIKYVASNLEIEDGHPLDNLVHDRLIQEINGEKYGIIGAVTPEIATVSNSSLEGIEVEDFDKTVEELQEEIDKLHKKGINKIIMVSHTGFEQDKKLVSRLAGVDIVISGHSHELIEGVEEGKNLLYGKDGKPVVIVQAGENGRNYGILNADFDAQGVIKKVQNTVLPTQCQGASLVDTFMDQVLGKSPVVGKLKSIDPFPPNKRIYPCAWANLLCDGMKNELGTDIALVNAANTRKVPPTGDLTVRQIQTTTPMKNKLLITDMSEKQIVEGIKFAAQSVTRTDGSPGIMQVSGLTYKIDDKGNLLELNFVNNQGTKEPLNIENPSDTRTFSVACDDFLANGREYPPFAIGDRKREQFDFDKDETLIRYISKMPQQERENLQITDDKRVQILRSSDTPQPNNSTQKFLDLTLPEAS